MIASSNPTAKIVLHRDRDYLKDEEAAEWEKQVRALNVEPFLTNGTDIEASFVNAAHLCELNPNISKDEFEDMIAWVANYHNSDFIERYVNGRVDIERKNGTYGQLNLGQLANEAPRMLGTQPEKYWHGKTLLRRLREEFRSRHSAAMRDMQPSSHLRHDLLISVSTKVFGLKQTK